MGGSNSSCYRVTNVIRNNTPVLHIRIIGLENAGKTSIISYMKSGKADAVTSISEDTYTESVTHGDKKILLWISKQDIQKTTINCPEGFNAIIFVVDGTDRDSFAFGTFLICSHEPKIIQTARDYLKIQLKETVGLPELLVLMNKSDLEGFATIEELHEALELDSIKDRQVRVVTCSALTGYGIRSAMDWLCHNFELRNGIYLNRKCTF